MAGYCPTGTNRSDFEMPASAPELRWALEVSDVSRWNPLVVAPSGRIYLHSGSQLLAVDDRGSRAEIAWTVDLGGAVDPPVLLADGSLFVVVRPVFDRRETVWLSPDGDVVRRADLPSEADWWWRGPALGVDGRLFFTVSSDDMATVLAVDPDGSLAWRAPLAGRFPTLAVSSDGTLVVSESVRTEDDDSDIGLVTLAPATGEVIDRTPLATGAHVVGGPAIGDDGSVYTVLWTHDSTVTTLVVLDPSREERFDIELPEPPWGGGARSLTIAPDGTAYVKEGRRLMAVRPDGGLVWELEAHPNIDVVGTLDAEGNLVFGGGASQAVDSRDGSILWTSEIPAHRMDRPGGGVSFAFPGPAVVGPDVLYYLADDGLLHAAAAPPI
jgi:hypothetical protein